MAYKISFTPKAEKDLGRLPKSIAKRILEKLKDALEGESIFKNAKPLTGYSTPIYRFRVGDYRLIFRREEKSKEWVLLVVLKVGHRREIYK